MEDIVSQYINEVTGLVSSIGGQEYPLGFLAVSLGLTKGQVYILLQSLRYFVAGYCLLGLAAVLIHSVQEQKPLSGWGRQMAAAVLTCLAALAGAAVQLAAGIHFGGLCFFALCFLVLLAVSIRRYVRMYGGFGLPEAVFETGFTLALSACHLLAAWQQDYRYYLPAGMAFLALLYMGRQGIVPKEKVNYYV